MDIQVGEYVRTKYGIAKYIDVEIKSLGIIVIDRYIAHDHTDDYKNVITPEEILKHSFNIIDLIEKGDYVNELKIIDINGICNDKKTKAFTIYKNKGKAIITFLKNEEIRSIVTKEQFKAMEYEVK